MLDAMLLLFATCFVFVKSMPRPSPNNKRTSVKGEDDDSRDNDVFPHDDEMSGDFMNEEIDEQQDDLWKINLNISKEGKTHML